MQSITWYLMKLTFSAAIVGKNKKTFGKLGVVEQVSGRGHNKIFVIKWRDSSTTTFDVMRKGFIQILHNGEDHWFTISTLGLPSGHVHIYDSLYNTCTDHGIEQICSILYTPNNAVHLHFMDVDKQTNHMNCGLYAIAYAIDLCRD